MRAGTSHSNGMNLQPLTAGHEALILFVTSTTEITVPRRRLAFLAYSRPAGAVHQHRRARKLAAGAGVIVRVGRPREREVHSLRVSIDRQRRVGAGGVGFDPRENALLKLLHRVRCEVEIEGAVRLVRVRLVGVSPDDGLRDLAIKSAVPLLLAIYHREVEHRLLALVLLSLNSERSDRGYSVVTLLQSALIVKAKGV